MSRLLAVMRRPKTRKTCKVVLALTLFVFVCLCLFHSPLTFHAFVKSPLTSSSNGSRFLAKVWMTTSPPVCHDVLRNMLKGRWHQRQMTSEEVERMRVFHKRVREEEHHIPKGIQRHDLKCGNVNVGVGHMLHFFKALCDPDGSTPCCYDNVCTAKTVAQCTCTNCQDMRTPIQAEYATWRPHDRSCSPRQWTQQEMCRLLNNATIHFIGDSLVRHVYTAFLLAIRDNFKSGAFRANIPIALRPFCSGLYMFSEKVCRLWLDEQATVCNGTVTVKNFHLIRGFQGPGMKDAVLQLANKSRSLVFLGVGFHDKFDYDLINRTILSPIINAYESMRLVWPRLLWANVHQFGLMRTPLTSENNEAVKTFNGNVQRFLSAHNVSVFDTYEFPANVMSFDGQHYGYGVNTMKVNILLHYIEELQSKGLW